MRLEFGTGQGGPARPTAEDRGVLRFLTCGSVDDGKSTLIGRLLLDTKTLLTDTLGGLERLAAKRGSEALDLSLLTDGLMAEREQGITIDVAYRYFATARRKFIIADSPGHEQYTRNMVTAASTADVAILLVDARKGILPQTKRHATIAALLGIRQMILAINKMDLVDYAQPVFEATATSFREWLAQHENWRVAVHPLPMSALEGAMVVDRGDRMPWYDGPTLIERLEDAAESQLDPTAPLRLPVQWVCRPEQLDFRGYAGRIEAGTLRVGDEVTALPGGAASRVVRIGLGEQSLTQAEAGQSVMVSLADERDISRGDMLVRTVEPPPVPSREVGAIVCWLSATPLSTARTYTLQHTTRSVKARFAEISSVLDIHSLAWNGAPGAVVLNDIARVRLKTQQPLVADAYAIHRDTGSFILVDETTHVTVAAGMIEDLS